MAGDWIKMRMDLKAHPKVVRIASALKADRLRIIGGLYSAWCLFDNYSTDGRMEGYTSEIFDEEIGLTGLAAAMISVGWLEQTTEGLVMPRFDAHNGQSAKRRAQDADRKREDRKIQNSSASEADKMRTREEKRREEKDIPPNPQGGDGAGRKRKVKQDNTPYEEIRQSFQTHLPTMPQPLDVSEWHDTRKSQVRARHEENKHRPDFWNRLFAYVAKSPYLTGQTEQRFEATFDWLLKPANLAKVKEGNYHKGAEQ